MALIALLVGLVVGCGSKDEPAQPSMPGSVALPGDFPKDEVPLVDGVVQSAGGDAKEGWDVTVQMEATRDGKPALDQAVAKLTEVGYAEDQRHSEKGRTVVFLSANKGKKFVVQVGSVQGASGGPNSVFYSVMAS